MVILSIILVISLLILVFVTSIVSKECDNLKDSISGKDGEIDRLRKETIWLNTQVSARDTDIEELKTSLSEAKYKLGKVTDLENEIHKHKERVKELEGECNEAAGDITDKLNSLLDERNSTVDSLNTTITNKNSEISKLKELNKRNTKRFKEHLDGITKHYKSKLQ